MVEEAEKLEHGISTEVAHLLMKRFGRDGCCPHGVPLFGGMSRLRRRRGAIRLSEAAVGNSYEVLRVYEKDPQFLDHLHWRPAATLHVHGREYDETMAITVAGRRGARIHLGKPATERLWVRRTSQKALFRTTN